MVVCGTGSFIAAMDGVDIDTETDRHEDNSNASTSEPQEPENEEMLDDQSGNNSSRQTSSPRVRFVGDDDSDESMVNQNVATGGEGDTFANTQIVSNGVASEDAAISASRGLVSLDQGARSREEQLESGTFDGLSNAENAELKKLVEGHMEESNSDGTFQDWMRQYSESKLVDKKLFGQRARNPEDTVNSIFGKYKGREQTAEAARQQPTDSLGGYREKSLETVNEFDGGDVDQARRDMLTSNNEFFNNLSDEDKDLLQERIDNGDQSEAMRQLFGEENLPDGDSQQDVWNRYKDVLTTEEEVSGLQHSEGLRDEIKGLEAKSNLSDQDKQYLAELKQSLEMRQKDLANIGEQTVAKRERYSGDLNLTQRSTTELANYQSEALRDKIEKARVRLKRVNEVENEDIDNALKELPDDATQEQKEAVIARVKESLKQDRAVFKNELDALLKEDQQVEKYRKMSDKERAFEFLKAVEAKVNEAENAFERRKESDKQDTAAFFANKNSIEGRLQNYEEILTSLSMNRLASEDDEFSQQRENIIKKINSQLEAVKDHEIELNSVKINQINNTIENIGVDVDSFRNYKKGTRTKSEYNELMIARNNAYGEMDIVRERLNKQEKALGVKEVTKRGWFGRKKTILDYSDVSDENRNRVEQIQKQLETLKTLQEELGKITTRLQETNPENYSFGGFKRLKWGSLSDGNPPVKYSLDDWNRLSNSYKRKMLKEDVQQYVDMNQEDINRVNSQDAPKRNWFGRGPKDPDSSFREMAQLRYNAPERYSEGHWLRLNSREKRNMPNKELLKFADEIGPYGGRYGEQKGITLEQNKRIKILDKAQEQMRAEDQRRGSPIFRRNQGQDTSIAAAA